MYVWTKAVRTDLAYWARESEQLINKIPCTGFNLLNFVFTGLHNTLLRQMSAICLQTKKLTQSKLKNNTNQQNANKPKTNPNHNTSPTRPSFQDMFYSKTSQNNWLAVSHNSYNCVTIQFRLRATFDVTNAVKPVQERGRLQLPTRAVNDTWQHRLFSFHWVALESAAKSTSSSLALPHTLKQRVCHNHSEFLPLSAVRWLAWLPVCFCK